jgi:glycosyltransferase involved in cell wall biosynthesis
MTSRYEGFPNALCEAMISGCACISYDCSTGPKEIINNGINGILSPERDMKLFSSNLQLLMNDKELRLKLGAESKKMKSLLSTESIMKKWDSIL